jgi:5-formyltetrahydrofolate cyclo-ligase
MSSELNQAKMQLRREIVRRLTGLTPEQRADGSEKIVLRILESPAWKEAQIVLLFAPWREEPDVWPLVEAGLKAGKLVTLPRMDPGGLTYHAREVKDLEKDIEIGKYGIREPRARWEIVAPFRLDLTLVPGVAFDLDGRRLGRGKGYYDRLLADVGGTTCGVAFDEQIVADIPVAPHDMRLNCILTPTRWQATGGPRAVLK